MYEVKRGVPFDPAGTPSFGGKKSAYVYPWNRMRSGDAFDLPMSDKRRPAAYYRKKVTQAGRAWLKANRKGWHIAVRTLEQEGVIRVWVFSGEDWARMQKTMEVFNGK